MPCSVKFSTLLAVAVLALATAQNYQDLQKLGVNFAFPSEKTFDVVPKLAQKAASLGVVRIKLFNCNPWVVFQLRKYYALAKAKLEIMVGMPQWWAKPNVGRPEDPIDWVAVQTCAEVMKNNSDIVTGVFVFNEPCVHDLCFGQGGQDLFDILGYYVDALKDHDMQVNVPFSSSCIFPMSPNKVPFFQAVLRLLKKTNSPITINLYPYLDYAFKPFNIPINTALGSEGLDGPLSQWSQIDADIARVHQDLAKLGPEFKDIPVQIGESGWAHAYGGYPLQGEPDFARKQRVYQVTTPEYANRFYLNLVNRLHTLGLAGIYIFELGSESWKTVAFPAYYGEKHFGISGLYRNSSEAPWHIDNPSKHPPWTGYATMRPGDWTEFDKDLAWLQTHVKQHPEDLWAVGKPWAVDQLRDKHEKKGTKKHHKKKHTKKKGTKRAPRSTKKGTKKHQEAPVKPSSKAKALDMAGKGNGKKLEFMKKWDEGTVAMSVAAAHVRINVIAFVLGAACITSIACLLHRLWTRGEQGRLGLLASLRTVPAE